MRGRGLAQFARQAARDADPFADHVRARLAPARQRTGVVDEVHADLFEDDLGILFDDREDLFGQDLEIGDVALDIPRRLDRDRRALCAPRGAASSAASASARTCFAHLPILPIARGPRGAASAARQYRKPGAGPCAESVP